MMFEKIIGWSIDVFLRNKVYKAILKSAAFLLLYIWEKMENIIIQ